MSAPKVLSTGFITVPNAAGGFDNKDNPSYWEAMLLLIKTNVALKENIDGMKGLLGDQLLIYGDTIGGTRWKSEYQKIIKDLGVVVPTPVEETPATAPTPGA